jgi:uncharacterized membrane protein
MTPGTEPRKRPRDRSRGRTKARWPAVALRRPDLALVAVGALVAWAAVLLLPPEHLVRAGLGLLLTTALPGYAASAALLGPRRVGGPDGVLLTLGLSLAIAILTGFTLNAVGASLSRETLAAALVIATLIGVGIAWARSPTAIYQATPLGRGAMPRLRLADAAVLGAAGVLLVVAVALARNGVAQQPTERFSSVWLVPNANATQVRVGVANHEGQRTTYRLVLANPTSIVLEWPAIAVEDGQQWEADAPVTNSQSRLELNLYLADKPGVVYRTASWGVIPGVEPGTEASPPASGSTP